jgi:hypothetical protein
MAPPTAPMQRRTQQKFKKEGKKKRRETNYMRVVETETSHSLYKE